MKKFIKEKYWDRFFNLGIIIKAINGLWETITGFLFLFLSKATFSYWFYAVAQNELLEDPNDRLINFLTHSFQNFSINTKTFVAIFLLASGILNIFLVIQLLRKKYWAYLATIWIMLVFMIYQVFRIYIHHSLVLTIITIYDAIFIVVIWHEYKNHKELKN